MSSLLAHSRRQSKRLAHELLSLTPGTDLFAQRLRHLTVELDAEAAKLELAIDESSRRIDPESDSGLRPKPPLSTDTRRRCSSCGGHLAGERLGWFRGNLYHPSCGQRIAESEIYHELYPRRSGEAGAAR